MIGGSPYNYPEPPASAGIPTDKYVRAHVQDMGLLKRLYGKLKSAGGGGSTFSDPGDNFICAGCRSSFKRQHHECPECGNPILVPIEETDMDGGGGGGGGGGLF